MLALLPCFFLITSSFLLILRQQIFFILIIILTSSSTTRRKVLINKIEVGCGQRVYTIDKGECRTRFTGVISPSKGSCVFQSFPYNSSSTCYELYASLDIEKSSFESFLMRLESEDRDVCVRSININFAAPYTRKYAEMIDDFLTTRPWWTIEEETFDDLHKCVSKPNIHEKFLYRVHVFHLILELYLLLFCYCLQIFKICMVHTHEYIHTYIHTYKYIFIHL